MELNIVIVNKLEFIILLICIIVVTIIINYFKIIIISQVIQFEVTNTIIKIRVIDIIEQVINITEWEVIKIIK